MSQDQWGLIAMRKSLETEESYDKQKSKRGGLRSRFSGVLFISPHRPTRARDELNVPHVDFK